MKKYILFLFASTLALYSCNTTTQLYSWYHYDDASHAFAKKQTQKTEQNLVNNFDKIINKQKAARKVVPPGIYAERGYYFLKSGQKDKAISYFNKEKELYPESSKFMNLIIKKIEQ